MTKEEVVQEFYQDVRRWLFNGAVCGKPFNRAGGLCVNLDRWLIAKNYCCFLSIIDAGDYLYEIFREAGLDVHFPFENGVAAKHIIDSTIDGLYQNEARLGWVIARSEKCGFRDISTFRGFMNWALRKNY